MPWGQQQPSHPQYQQPQQWGAAQQQSRTTPILTIIPGYRDPRRVILDADQAHANCPTLVPKSAVFKENTGALSQLLQLDGLVPINFKVSATYSRFS